MIRKLTICLLLLLNVYSTAHSQVFEITHSQAKEAIKASQIADNLLIEVSLQKELITQYKGLNQSLEESLAIKVQQLSLAEKNFAILKSLYDAEKEKKSSKYGFKDFLNDLALVGVGIVLGFVLLL